MRRLVLLLAAAAARKVQKPPADDLCKMCWQVAVQARRALGFHVRRDAAPNATTWKRALLAGFVAALFVMSHVGKALLRSCGVSPEAIAHIPGIDAAVRVVRACYAAAKGRLRKTAPFVKLDDIEAAAGKIKAEPSVEARLATIEELLQRAYGELAAKGASGTPANQTQAPGVISRFNA